MEIKSSSTYRKYHKNTPALDLILKLNDTLIYRKADHLTEKGKKQNPKKPTNKQQQQQNPQKPGNCKIKAHLVIPLQ